MEFTQYRLLACGVAAISILVLNACSTYEQGHPGNPLAEGARLGGAKGDLNSGSGFTGDLGRNYYALATHARVNKNWVDSDYFAGKSASASKGEVVQPELTTLPLMYPPLPAARASEEGELAEHARNWLIAGNGNPGVGEVRALNDARAGLVATLDNGGRERAPALAARAQALYDCWVAQSERDVKAAFNGQCHRDFVRDYTDLTVLLNPPVARNAYFEHDSAQLTPEGQQQIRAAVTRISSGTAHLQLVGKADRTGTEGYNTKLSEQRAQAIRAAAVADGLTANRLDTKWTGDQLQYLPVKTPDNVNEPRNRVVEIDTIMPSSQVAELPPAE